MNETKEHFTQRFNSLFQDHGHGDLNSILKTSLGFADQPNISRGRRVSTHESCNLYFSVLALPKQTQCQNPPPVKKMDYR